MATTAENRPLPRLRRPRIHFAAYSLPNTPFDEACPDGRVARTIVAYRTVYEYI